MTIEPPKNTLIVALSGIGNLLMQLPALTALKKQYPDAKLTAWLEPRGTRPIAEAAGIFDEIIEKKFKQSLPGHLRLANSLAQRKFNTALMMYPGQLWKGAAYMFLSGANQRIAHRYPHLGNPHSGFLLTDPVDEIEGIHDIEQNFNLLKPFGIDSKLKAKSYQLNVPQIHQQQAEDLIDKLDIPREKLLIGLHAGSASHFTWKRWPLERFAEVAAIFIQKYNAHILIFGGPDEKKQKAELKTLIEQHLKAKSYQLKAISVIDASLLTIAAVIKHCNFFLANDSGLMHTAAAVGVRTYGLFGPTNETQKGPRGVDSHVIRAPGTEPIFDVNKNYNLGPEPHETLLKLTPELVLNRIRLPL